MKGKHNGHHPHGKMNVDMKSAMMHGITRGMLPWFVLAQLSDGPLYGNEIIHSMSEQSAHKYKPSPGSIYPILRKYEEQGLIEGEWKSGKAAAKKVYKLTRKGRSVLPKIRKQLIDEMKITRHILDLHIKAMEG